MSKNRTPKRTPKSRRGRGSTSSQREQRGQGIALDIAPAVLIVLLDDEPDFPSGYYFAFGTEAEASSGTIPVGRTLFGPYATSEEAGDAGGAILSEVREGELPGPGLPKSVDKETLRHGVEQSVLDAAEARARALRGS